MKLKELGELGLIRNISKAVKTDSSVVKGIGDDTAVIKWTAGKYLLFTCDMLVEGVHFTKERSTPLQVGYKALARNLSDIAAMGGIPRYALVSAGLDPETPASYAAAIFKGINALAKKYHVNIVGGDTVRSKKAVIDISLIGEVEKKNLVLRSGAKEGDLIFVTGSLGGSAKGRHLNFVPRIEEARFLVKNFKISSMIDISDGLALDLGRLIDASAAGAMIYEKLIPLSKDAASFKSALSDGEDFELIFTASAKEASKMAKAGAKTPISLIGRVMGRKYGRILIDKNGREKRLEPRGYLHFR